MSIILHTNKNYKYGLENNTIDVVFKNQYINIKLTNELCGGDPVYGKLKYLYDDDWSVVCKEFDYINIVKNDGTDVAINKDYLNDISNRLTRINYIEGNINIYVINLKYRTDRLEHIKKEFSRFDFINLIIFEAFHDQIERIGFGKSHLALINYAKYKWF